MLIAITIELATLVAAGDITDNPQSVL